MFVKKWFRTFLAIFSHQDADASSLFRRLPATLQPLVRIIIVWHAKGRTFVWIQGNRNLSASWITLGQVAPLTCDPIRFVFNYDRIFMSQFDYEASYHIGTLFRKGTREKPKILEAVERLKLFYSVAQ